MNFLFIIASALICSAQETYKKIEVEAPPLPSSSSSSGLNLNNDFKEFTEESLGEMPNVNTAGGTNRPRYLQIRGIGETGTYENTPSHSVGFFVDDIDLTGVSAAWPTLNVKSFSVDRGPQSTQWGGNVIGGKLSAVLQDVGAPARAELSYQTQSAFQTGIEGDLSRHTRGFIFFNQDPGFYRNTYIGAPGADRREYYVSLKNRFTGSANWRVTSSHIGMKTNNGYDVWSLNRPNVDDDFDTLSDQQGEDSVVLHGHALRVERKLSAENALVSLSSLARSESVYSYDADWGNNAYWQNIPGWNQPYDYFDKFTRARTAWHQKLFLKRAESEAGLHLYGLHEDSDITHFKNKLFKENNSSQYNTLSAALFADTHVPITDRDSLLLGGRYEAQTLRYTDTFLPGLEKAYRFSSWQTGWHHEFSDGFSTQATVSQGFKSPGFNVDNTDPTINRSYYPEYVTSYEVGFAAKTPSALLTTNIFLMNHRDKQVKVSRQDDPMDPSSFTYFTNNAARATSYGAEIGARQRWGTWKTEMQIGLLKAEFRDYYFENQDRRGRDLAHAPTWNYAAGVTKNWSERFSTNLTLTGKNDFAFSNNHEQRSQAYHLMDLGATYKRDRWALSAFIKNVFDDRYQTRGFYFANEPPNWENKLYVQYGPPRFAGLNLSYVF